MVNIVISIILLIVLIVYGYKISKQYNIIKEDYENIQKELISGQQELTNINNSCNNLQNKIKTFESVIAEKETQLSSAEKALKTQETTSKKAFENYCDLLNKQYKEAEEEWDRLGDVMESAYSGRQLKLMQEIEEISADLDQLRSTRAAAIEAQRREKEIKEQSSFYCLKISEEDIEDVNRLNRIKPSLNSPRVLSMLVWSSFYQKPLKALAARVLGTTSPVCGIYKITNQDTGECYIGQARDTAKRWSDHAKCGLGIDTPASNKLYAAMAEYGLHKFSFELLEAVSADKLDEKEQFFIELYDSVSNGYNTLRGTNLKK